MTTYDNGVTGGNGRGNLVKGHQYGDVPWDNGSDNSVGLLEGEVEMVLGHQTGVTVDIASNTREV